MITDNSFTADSISTRLERLQLIELNFPTHSAVLVGLPSEVATWALTCFTVFKDKRNISEVEVNESVGATTATKQAFAFLRSEYSIVKGIAETLFASQQTRYEAYGFNLSYPSKFAEQLSFVEDVLIENTRMIAQSKTPVIEPALITRLSTAVNGCIAALETQAKEKGDVKHARGDLKEEWELDTFNLKALLFRAIATWNDDHINLNDLGFARKSQMGQSGGGGTLPQAPSGLHLDGETLAWTAVTGATSYAVGLSYDGGTHWESDFTTDTNSSTVPVADIGKLYYRVRARNANGYGDYSGTFEHLFGLATVDNFAFANDEFTWNPVEFANGYDIQYSLANEENFVLIFNGNATSFNHTPASGSWTFRIRASYGAMKSEWVEIPVEQV
ncbi:MAG: hypothetical protein JST20_12040 [Bacteroidetes bacterium]|nr:hypothetical protein [Bacteroidota bacterium]